MPTQTVSVRLIADVATYKAAMLEAARSTAAMSAQAQGHLNRLGSGMSRVGKNMTKYVSLPLVGLGALATKAAVDWESAWTGVTKTVDGTKRQMSQLEAGLRGMAKELPATHEEIAAVAEAAGALGIATPNVLGFTKTMIDMGETTNLTADQAATAMARIATVTRMPQTEFDRLGSTVVDLGNKSNATESEITEMMTGIASSGSQVGLANSEIAAFAAALASVGIEAEAGGSSFSRIMFMIERAAEQGGEKLQTFARLAGESASQFQASFQDDAAGAIAAVVEGLGDMTERGQSIMPLLDQLGFKDIRVARAMRDLANSGELVNNMLEVGRDAWDENSALADEAAKRYATTAAEVEVLRNKAVDFGVDVGGQLVPALSKVVDVADSAFGSLQVLPDPIIQTGLALGTLAAAAGPVIWAGGKIAGSVVRWNKVMEFAATGPTALHAGLARLPGALAAAGVAFAGAATSIGLWDSMMKAAEGRATAFADSVRPEVFTRAASGMGELDAVLTDLNLQMMRLSEEEATSAAPWDADRRHEIRAGVNEMQAMFDEVIQLRDGARELAAQTGINEDQALKLVSAQKELGLSTQGVEEQLGTLRGQLTDRELKAVGRALGVTTEGFDTLSSMVTTSTQRLGAWGMVLDNQGKAIHGWQEAVGSAMDAAASSIWSFSQEAQDNLGAFGREADQNLQDFRSWQESLTAIARRGGKDLALEWAELGPEFAGAARQMADAGTEEFMLVAEDMLTYGKLSSENYVGQWRKARPKVKAEANAIKADVGAAMSAAGTSILNASSKVLNLGASLDSIDGKKPKVVVTAETAVAQAQLSAVVAMLAAIQSKTITVTTVAQVQGPVPGSVHSMPEKRASGGPVGPGQLYLVGEEGPELVTFASRGLVHDADSTARMLQGAGDGGQRVGEALGLGFGDGIAAGVLRSTPHTTGALRSMGSDLLTEMEGIAANLTSIAEEALSAAWGGVAARESRDSAQEALKEARRGVDQARTEVRTARQGVREARHGVRVANRQLDDARADVRRIDQKIAAVRAPVTRTRLDSRIATTRRILTRSRRTGDSDTELNAAWDLSILQDQRAEALAAANEKRLSKLKALRGDRRSAITARRGAQDAVVSAKDARAGAVDTLDTARDRAVEAQDAVSDAMRGLIEQTTHMITRSRATRHEWIQMARQAELTAAEIRGIVDATQDLHRVQRRTAPVSRTAGQRASIDQAIDAVFANVGAELDSDLGAKLARLVHSGRIDMGDVRRRARRERREAIEERRAERREKRLGRIEKQVENLYHARDQSVSDYDAKQLAKRLASGDLTWEALKTWVAGLPAKALGGPVRAGAMYLVGERGPEVFRPDRNGRIIPNHETGAFLAAGGGRTAALERQVATLVAKLEHLRPIAVHAGAVTDAEAARIGAMAAREIAFQQMTPGV